MIFIYGLAIRLHGGPGRVDAAAAAATGHYVQQQQQASQLGEGKPPWVPRGENNYSTTMYSWL